MESTENSTEINTSIGAVYVEAEGRDWFTIRSAHDYGEPWPHFYKLTLARDGEHWEFTKPTLLYHPQVAENERIKEVPMPPALVVDELLKLATEWANAHPEEFEKAARAEFDDLLLEMVDETFNELARICGDAQRRFRDILDEPEFAAHASVALRRRVQKEAQRLRVMPLQTSGAARAINTLAGRLPLGPENQRAAHLTIVNRGEAL
jgi:hypothetical protein